MLATSMSGSARALVDLRASVAILEPRMTCLRNSSQACSALLARAIRAPAIMSRVGTIALSPSTAASPRIGRARLRTRASRSHESWLACSMMDSARLARVRASAIWRSCDSFASFQSRAWVSMNRRARFSCQRLTKRHQRSVRQARARRAVVMLWGNQAGELRVSEVERGLDRGGVLVKKRVRGR